MTMVLPTSFAYVDSTVEQRYKKTLKTQTIPPIQDPTPGYWETSEYMIGSVAVGIILPESNGLNDTSTEDWTPDEEQNVFNEIQYALDWWASQNPDADVSFVTEVNQSVPTRYEPISRPSTDRDLWIGEIMSSWGYENTLWFYQVRDYVNALRDKHDTDWAFAIFVVDSSNDSDGRFADGPFALAERGGPSLYLTYDCGGEGIANMDKVCAHEIGHIFWAADEYVNDPVYRGYLNVSSIPHSGCLMDDGSWCLSGAPHGDNGTWGQVGWRDNDGDGIQSIPFHKFTSTQNG